MAVLQGAEATEIGNKAVQCNMMQQAAVSLNPGVFISFVGRVSLWGSWKFGRGCLECIEWVLHTSEGQDLIEVQEFEDGFSRFARCMLEHTFSRGLNNTMCRPRAPGVRQRF